MSKVQAWVDEFLTDCILPTTSSKEVVQNKQVYEWYQEWSDHAGLPILTDNAFGRCLARRLHRTRRNGKVFYYCRLNPKVTD